MASSEKCAKCGRTQSEHVMCREPLDHLFWPEAESVASRGAEPRPLASAEMRGELGDLIDKLRQRLQVVVAHTEGTEAENAAMEMADLLAKVYRAAASRAGEGTRPPACCKCGETEYGGYEWDSKVYCVDCWPGYDDCADPRCTHYRIEHDLHLGEAVYIKPGCEETAKEFENTQFHGCANAGCPCERFIEAASAPPERPRKEMNDEYTSTDSLAVPSAAVDARDAEAVTRPPERGGTPPLMVRFTRPTADELQEVANHICNAKMDNVLNPQALGAWTYAEALFARLQETLGALAQAEAQRQAGYETEKRDCAKALTAMAGFYVTPAEGYGSNSSWAIADLCRAVEQGRRAEASLQAAQQGRDECLRRKRKGEKKTARRIAELQAEVTAADSVADQAVAERDAERQRAAELEKALREIADLSPDESWQKCVATGALSSDKDKAK